MLKKTFIRGETKGFELCMSVIFYSPFWWKGTNYDVDVSLKVTANMVNLCLIHLAFCFICFLQLIGFNLEMEVYYTSVKARGHLRIRWCEKELETFASRHHRGFVPRCKRLYKPLIHIIKTECSRLLCNPGLHTVIISNWRAAIFFAFSLYGQGKH